MTPEEAPHPAFAPLLIGQVVEWLVWSRLVSSAEGDLRIFLPTRDMGIDGIVHRHSTDELVCVQVKGRTRLEDGVFRVHVQEHEVSDDATMVIAVVADVVANTLRDPAMVLSAARLRAHAPLVDWGPRRAYALSVPYPPGPRTHWADVCVPTRDIGARVAPPGPGATAPATTPSLEVAPEALADQERLATTGFIGESALLHHAALSPRLNAFHAAPDVGFIEYVIRNVVTGSVNGYQVKCVEVDERRQVCAVHIPSSTLSLSAQNRLLIFLRGPGGDVVSPCLLIPASDISQLTHPTRDPHLTIRVNTADLGPLARYAVRLHELAGRLEKG